MDGAFALATGIGRKCSRGQKGLWKALHGWRDPPKQQIMRDTNGHVYVMQTYAKFVNKDIDEDMLPKLAGMLTLLPGWKFETKVLEKDLTIIPDQGVAHVIVDDFQDVYEGCGFDAACNFVP
jgi:hypothetical protein